MKTCSKCGVPKALLFFIYALKCPTTGRVRYIGVTSRPTTRLGQHLSPSSLEGDCHRVNWLRSLKRQGLRPTIEFLAQVPEVTWPQNEKDYIVAFRSMGCDLVNGTAGGEGCASGDKNPGFGKKQSPEHVEKRKLSMPRGEKHHLHGLHQLEETRKKITATKVGVKAARNKSGIVGVSRCKQTGGWRPHFCLNKKRLHLGRFKNLEDAVFVRALAVDKYFSKSP